MDDTRGSVEVMNTNNNIYKTVNGSDVITFQLLIPFCRRRRRQTMFTSPVSSGAKLFTSEPLFDMLLSKRQQDRQTDENRRNYYFFFSGEKRKKKGNRGFFFPPSRTNER